MNLILYGILSLLILLVKSELQEERLISGKEMNHWCTAQGCRSCTGNSCSVTCKGFKCGECPTGSCCDGKNCNACYKDNCCTTQSCNFCLTSCKHACNNTVWCQDFCTDQCRNGTNEVFVITSNLNATGFQKVTVYVNGHPYKGRVSAGQIKNTNETAKILLNGTVYSGITIVLPKNEVKKKIDNFKSWKSRIENIRKRPIKREACCKDDGCNSCLKKCNSKCISPLCCNVCSRKCKPSEVTQDENREIYKSTHKRLDATTTINITNLINNTKRIEIPINITNVDRNDYQYFRSGCCHVVHPQQCVNNNVYPYKHCFRRNHQECSNLCSSQFVHFTQNSELNKNQCHRINTYPYVYCGQHSLKNCDSCYICDGRYNPGFCSRQRGCNSICRKSISLPPRFNNGWNFQTIPMSYPQQNVIRAVYPGTLEYEQLLKLLGSRGEYVEDSS